MSTESEPLILAIETATRAGSISLARGENVLGSLSGDATASHSIDLIENIDNILRRSSVKLGDIDLFGVASGPGSFTGLRIGLATVKSFAAYLGRKCVGISTLAAIAHAAGSSDIGTVALLPAGRGEVFAQMFSVEKSRVEALDTAAHITPEKLLEKYGNVSGLRWAGEGAHLHSENLRTWAAAHDIVFDSEVTGSGWVIASRSEQLAVSVSALALTEFRSGRAVSPDELRADYVRASDAEINERWQEKSPPPAVI